MEHFIKLSCIPPGLDKVKADLRTGDTLKITVTLNDRLVSHHESIADLPLTLYLNNWEQEKDTLA